jgi:hypothetical protein
MANVVATMFKGKMTKCAEPRNPQRANFVIVCMRGDWSGFRTLAECESQYAELERYHAADANRDYWVEER